MFLDQTIVVISSLPLPITSLLLSWKDQVNYSSLKIIFASPDNLIAII